MKKRVSSEPASLLRVAQQPAEAGCRTAASRTQKMVSSRIARPATCRSRPPYGGPHSAEDGVEAAETPARSSPTIERSRLPDVGSQSAKDGGLQSAEGGVVDSRKPPARCNAATSRSRPSDGGQQSAEDVVVEDGKSPVRRRPATDRSRLSDCSPQTAKASCRTAAHRVQKMLSLESASSQRAEDQQLVEVGFRTGPAEWRRWCRRSRRAQCVLQLSN
jgi:hypothetical protein